MAQISYGTITITDTTDLEWFYGTILDGTGDATNHQITLTTNLITGAAAGSMYLNTQTSLAYKCVAASDTSQTWQYVGNMASGVINNISIGGRNLLLDTGTSHTSAGSTSGNVYVARWAQSDYLANMDLVVDETVFTMSFDYEVVGNTATDACFWVQFHGNAPTDANIIASNANRPSINKQYMYVNDNPKGHYWITFKYTSNQASGSVNINRVRLRYATDGATIKVSNLKLELGNKATDWTPAPEDIDNAIAEVKQTADAAAPKSSAVAKTQRIYYRSNSSTKPTAYPTAWVTEEGDKWNSNATTAAGWSRKVTPISNGIEDTTKYLFLWTATQRQMADGTVIALTANDIALDDSTTVIDGGNIITNTITANSLNVDSINTSNKITIGAFETASQEDILNKTISDEMDSKFEQIDVSLGQVNDLIDEHSSAIQTLNGQMETIMAPIELDASSDNPFIKIQAINKDSPTSQEFAYLLLTKDRISFFKVTDADNDLSTQEDQIKNEVLYIDSTESQGVIDINNARVHQSIRIGQLEIFQYNGGIAVRRTR